MENKYSNEMASQGATSRYANILLDYWFKRTFGRDISKRLMILVLREIIPEIDIQDITYTNKEHPNPFPDDHGGVFDIECKSSDDEVYRRDAACRAALPDGKGPLLGTLANFRV